MSVTVQQVKSGMLWIAGISMLRDALQFAVMLVLVRLLDARAYGEYSLVSSIVALLTVFSLHSFLEYTLQVRPGEPVDYQAQFTFGGFSQLIAILALNITGAALSRIPAYAPVAPVLYIMSISFVVDWAAELRVKMLERELAWSRLRMLEAIGILANAVSAIALALSGAGVYSLLIPAVIALIPFVYDLFFVLRWWPTWTFDWKSFQPAWHYGLTRMGSGLVARGQQVLESGVLAGVIGLASLGVYGRAVGLASFACLKLTSVMTLTLFPMVTRFAPNSEPFRRASALVIRAVAWTSIPAAAVLSMDAKPLVETLYGARWIATVPLLPLALATASLTALMEAAAFLLLTNLEPRKTLVIDVINLAGTALALWWMLPFGIIAYMATLLVVQLIAAAIALVWLIQSGGLTADAVAQALVMPLIAAAAITAIARFTTIQSLTSAVIFGLVFTLIYIAALCVFSRLAFFELLRFLPLRSRSSSE